MFVQEPVKFTYGRKNDRMATIYPLAMGDQLRLSKMLWEIWSNALEKVRLATAAIPAGASEDELAQVTSATMVQTIVDTISENIDAVADVVLDFDTEDHKQESIKDHLTNLQLAELAKTVWEMNYDIVRKNYGSLLPTVGQLTGIQLGQKAVTTNQAE